MTLSHSAAFVILVAVLFVIQSIRAQDAPAPAPDAPAGAADPPKPPVGEPAGAAEGEDDIDRKFISFEHGVDDSDVFRYDKMEYIMVPARRNNKQAYLTCKQYNAQLAYFETTHLLNFIAAAMSETRLELDTLWVAAARRTWPNNDTHHWTWIREDGEVPLSSSLEESIEKDLRIEANDRDCMGIGRLDHDKPQLRPLACNARRTMICQRPRGSGGTGNSTHPGWIKIRTRYYKIYADKLTYDSAEEVCASLGNDVYLAVVATFEDAQQLGRYLLIGRPSLENAWIGAKWTGNAYAFDAEPRILANATDGTTKYPPWRSDKMMKPSGCLLLDRHLANITLFVEARCERERAVICYKVDKNKTDGSNSTDVIIGPNGYRLMLAPKLRWEKARDFCRYRYERWNSKLVEIDAAEHDHNLLYVMGENKSAVQHIWTGGYHNQSEWYWISTNKLVDRTLLNWVRNNSFEQIVEQGNTCLDMDRENHVKSLHYGSNCKFSQNFVCWFPADKLRELQEEELRNRTRRSGGDITT